MAFPNSRQVRWIIKPLWFVACLSPFIWMNLQAFGIVGSTLGDDAIAATQEYMGIWALRMLLLTLAITPLRKLSRQPWLIRLRRMTGLFALFYASMHFLNYTGADKRFDWPAIFSDIFERPFIVLGVIGLFGLVLLGVTSTNAWQRRLGRRWNTLHRLIYPIVVLIAVHFWWQAEKSYLEPAIYTGIIAALLGYRWLVARRKLVTPAPPAPVAADAER